MWNKPRIGLIGVGLLGSAVAERLCGAGYRVSAFDSHTNAVSSYPRLDLCDSAAEAAGKSTIVFTCLPDGPIVRRAVLEEGVAGSLGPGGILIDLTTCAPDESRSLAAELGKRGIPMLDAPVSAGSRQIARGEGLMMVGGPSDAFERALPLLTRIVDRVRYLGPSGNGSLGKLTTNLTLGLNRLALAEGLAFAEAAGMAPDTALGLLCDSAAYSRVMDVKGPRMVEHRYTEPEARLRQHLKDVELILALAAELHQQLPASSLHAELLRAAVSAGLGDADNAAVREALREVRS